MNLILSGPAIYTQDGVVNEAALVINEGKIVALAPESSLQKFHPSQVLSFPATYHLLPGFIDLHVHGANGFDVMDATQNALAKISLALAKEGTTSFLATTMTANVSRIENTLKVIHSVMQNKNISTTILGVHLEGPFISPDKKGAQREDEMLMPDVALVKKWQQLADIKIVTLAPEKLGSDELIVYLKEQQIVPAIGHTNATYAETVAAISKGCSHATHLFNAMRGISQREPGVVTAVLLSDDVSAELIVDGVHLHPAIVKLALKNLGDARAVLVTDSMRAKCMRDGCYDLGGQEVQVDGMKATLKDGTLAGSVLPMISALKNVMAFTGCDLFAAMKMATENPAKVIGVFDKKGSIALDKDADLVVLDDKLNVVLTICEGKVKFQQVLCKVNG